MLPQRPAALDPDFAVNFSQCEATAHTPASTITARFAPPAAFQLTGHRCKLVCTQCGYYLSCADYY